MAAFLARRAEAGEGEEATLATGTEGVQITLSDLRQYLAATQTLASQDPNSLDENESEDDEDEEISDWYYPRQTARPWTPPVTEEPQDEGVRLLNSGNYGYIGPKRRAKSNYSNTTKAILNAATKSPSSASAYREETQTNLVPNTNGSTVASYDHNIYTAQFSDDSSFYYTCAQDFRLHIFDMTKPPYAKMQPPPNVESTSGRFHSNLRTTMPLRKEITGVAGNWTITDANLSPDNTRIIYSSIMSTVYMTSTSPDGSSQQIPISFAESRTPWGYTDQFGIWSCRFSADGNEVVAGGDGKIFVYDLLANKRTVKISAHDDDVNSCCWADTESGNVLISASDDTFLKVWDRRSLGASQTPSGVLIGHTEGITYVSAKGDGRYVISNGKDQALRLWDLRMMCSNSEYEAVKNQHYGVARYDYRRMAYPAPRYTAHPKDCSVMTYRGHSVLRTLIRCHFSPAETTGSQYLYSGSADGRVHIWSLDGRIVQVLDRAKTLPSTFKPYECEPEETNVSRTGNCVRDVSWHSQEPVIMSAAWTARPGGTIIARHEWKGLSKMHWKLEDWVEKERQEASESPIGRPTPNQLSARRRSQHVPGSYIVSDDEDDSDWVDEDE